MLWALENCRINAKHWPAALAHGARGRGLIASGCGRADDVLGSARGWGEQLEGAFGPNVAALVEGVSRVSEVNQLLRRRKCFCRRDFSTPSQPVDASLGV